MREQAGVDTAEDDTAIAKQLLARLREPAGKLLAEWAIARTDGKANVLVVTALDSYSSESIINGIMLFRRRLVAIAKFGDASGDRTEFRRSARFGGSSGSLDFE